MIFTVSVIQNIRIVLAALSINLMCDFQYKIKLTSKTAASSSYKKWHLNKPWLRYRKVIVLFTGPIEFSMLD